MIVEEKTNKIVIVEGQIPSKFHIKSHIEKLTPPWNRKTNTKEKKTEYKTSLW